jgi:hypothetical protein
MDDGVPKDMKKLGPEDIEKIIAPLKLEDE